MIEAGGLQLPEIYLMEESTRELMFQVLNFLTLDPSAQLRDVGQQSTFVCLPETRYRDF